MPTLKEIEESAGRFNDRQRQDGEMVDVRRAAVLEHEFDLLIRAARQSQEMRLDLIHIRKWSKQEAGDLSAGQILEALQRMTTEALLKFDPDVLELLEGAQE